MPSYRPQEHVHKLVAETASAMAHELYDTMMFDDEWYRLWKKQNPGVDAAKELERRFVKKNVAQLVPQARAALAEMLTTAIDPALKETILEALSLDATLLRPGIDPQKTRGIIRHETL